jgi:adenine deaminase
LRTFKVESVYKDGLLVARQGKLQDDASAGVRVGASHRVGARRDPYGTDPARYNSIHIGTLTEQDLHIAGTPGLVEVIGIEPGQIITRHLREDAPLRDGEIVADPARDLLKLVVIERHSASGRVGLGLVKGFGLRKGAIASSVAHDAHNIVIAGVNDSDILRAAQVLAEIGGGFACVVDGQVRATVPLPIGGLVSPLPAPELVSLLQALDTAATELGCTLEHPCMTLSFLSLSVIPSLKLTDQGLIDVDTFTICPLQR